MAKIGVIGTGKWGKNHARVYSELAKEGACDFVGIADINQEAKELADQYGVKFETDYKSLLNEVDAVSIAVPTDLHYKIVKDCLEAGKHVLVEKPITLDSGEAKELEELAKSKNLILTVGFLYRYNPAVQKLKELVGELGNIQYITSRFVHSNKPPRKDCGVIFNFAVHAIDILDFVLEKKPKKVYCKKMNFLSPDREDVAFIIFDYGDFIAEFEVSWFHPLKKRDMWVIAEKEKVYVDLLEQKITKYPIEINLEESKSGDSQEVEINKNEPLTEELKDFCKMIDNKDIKIRESYSTVRLCELCLESAKTGNEVSTDEL